LIHPSFNFTIRRTKERNLFKYIREYKSIFFWRKQKKEIRLLQTLEEKKMVL
jgi:hypothetical protein